MSGIGPANTFGEGLRAYRLAAGLTQEDLAERSGISARQIRRLEAGTHSVPRHATVRMLGRALGLTEERCRHLMQRAYPYAWAWPDSTLGPFDQAPELMRTVYRPAVRSGNVHAMLTLLVGREAIIARIRARIQDPDSRLITITGPPGIGKTRVALEVARRLDAELPGGAHFVWLAPLREAARVPAEIADAFTSGSERDSITAAELSTLIGNEAQLLVLDNLEHVIEAAPLIPELLLRCPELRILVTIRVRLNVSGENLEPLSPLDIPQHQTCQTQALLGRTEAEELFVLRARAVDPQLQISETTGQLIAEVCRRVDGLPLAIELAAAQFGRHALDRFESSFDRLLPRLVDGPIDQPERLRTMLKSLEWSYSLLTAEEQQLLRHLSVFPGGADLAALVAVNPGEMPSAMIAELLDRLVEQNLVIRNPASAGGVRYELLELIREYAAHLLQEHGEANATRRRMASHYVSLAERYERLHWLPDGTPLPVRLAGDLPNLWEALRWLEETGDGNGLLRLTGSLHGIWTSGGYLRDGQRWLQRALEVGMNGPPRDRSRCRVSLGHIHFYKGELDRAGDEYAVALQEATEAEDPAQLTWVATAFGALEISRDNYLAGRTLSERALSAAASASDGDRELAGAIAIWVPGALGRAEHGLGNFDKADAWFRLGVEQMEAHRQQRGAARVLEAWGTLAVDQGAPSVALERFRSSMAMAHESGDDAWVAVCLPMAAWALGHLHRQKEAVQLLSAADAWGRASGQLAAFSSMNSRVGDEALRFLRASMPPSDFQAAWNAGSRLSMGDAVAFLHSLTLA